MSGILLGTEYTKIRVNEPSKTSARSVNNTAVTVQHDKDTGREKGAQKGERLVINLWTQGISTPGRRNCVDRDT